MFFLMHRAKCHMSVITRITCYNPFLFAIFTYHLNREEKLRFTKFNDIPLDKSLGMSCHTDNVMTLITNSSA